MDNRLREIEQWVAEARDGLGDGGREAYVRKLYLLDAEIRAVIKDSGILPQVVSPRPATSLVRHLSSLALPVASAVVVLAVATVYLRGGIPNHVNSILTARPESAQKNTPPAGPSSPPADWQQYLASRGETVVEFASVPESTAPAKAEPSHPVHEHVTVLLAANKPIRAAAELKQPAAKPTEIPVKSPIILASAKKPAGDANESTSVAASPVMLASYQPAPAESAPAQAQPAPRKVKNRKAVKPVASGDEVAIDTDKIIADVEKDVFKH